ncbi:hypothetical protein V2O64_23665 [Verrucomicrobiaceae bacterium 227]
MNRLFFKKIGLTTLVIVTQSLPCQGQLALIRQGRESVGIREFGDWHGATLALGDFDGDGYDDLAAAAPFEKSGSDVFSAGSVIINRGSPHGITWEDAYALSPIDGSLETNINLQMGKALAVGDFNGDDFDDLAVGLPAASVNGQSAAGRVFVYYGGPQGLPGVATTIHQGMLGAAVESGDTFGDALAAGRLGNDRYDDLVIGSTGENGDRGAVFVIRGGPNGLNLSQRQILLGEDMGHANQPGDRFGSAIAIGNIIGFPGAELIVGAPLAELTASVPSSGLVYIANTSDISVATNSEQNQVISPLTFGDKLFTQGNFGMSFAIGDFWSDESTLDLAIGAPGAHDGGRVYLGRGTPLGTVWDTILQQPNGWGADDKDDGFGRALAAGDHDNDGDDELAVGCPGQDIILAFKKNSGSVHIFDGKDNGPSLTSVTNYTDFDLGDEITGEGWLGYSLAAGRTSASLRESFVVGAPRKDDDRGQVFDIAPWRQVMRMLSRSALAADCEGNIVYALRPFDTVFLASTTKIMTVLLGCEATTRPQNDPLRVNLTDEYTIEDWMYQGFPLSSGCSIFGYTPLPTNIFTESYTFEELLRTCVMVSGNDSCYAVADAMTGEVNSWEGHYDSAPQFVQLMNDRAAQIGMNDSHFSNPAGVGSQQPTSTAYDMWLLSKEAMKNELFRDLVSTTDFPVQKIVSGGEAGVFQTANVNVSYGWLKGMQSMEPTIIGLKPGGTPEAKSTRVAAAQFGPSPTKLAYGMGFRWSGNIDNPFNPGSQTSLANVRTAQLVQLGLSFCNVDFETPGEFVNPTNPPHGWTVNDGVLDALQSSQFGSDPEETIAGNLTETGDIKLRIFPRQLSNPQGTNLTWKYRSLWEIQPGSTVGLTVSPAVAARAQITNLNMDPRQGDASLRVASPSVVNGSTGVSLAPYNTFELPDWTNKGDGEWMIQVVNANNFPVMVSFVGEFDLRPEFSGRAGESFLACLEPLGISLRDGHTVCEREPSIGDRPIQIFASFESQDTGVWQPEIAVSGFHTGASFEKRVPRLKFASASPFEDIPLGAYYDQFQVEFSKSLRGKSWSVIDTIPATKANSYEWFGESTESAKGFIRLKGSKARKN